MSMLRTATAPRPCTGRCAPKQTRQSSGRYLDGGADTEARDVDGRTPLHVAARFADNHRILETLLDHGANIDAKDNGGDTPLDLAKRHYNPVAIEIRGATEGG